MLSMNSEQRGERRQTVCTEPFKLGNARRGALRVRNAAFLIANLGTANERGAVMLKSISAVMAAAAFAGVLTLLWATNTWIDARARDAAPQSTPLTQTAPAPAAVAISSSRTNSGEIATAAGAGAV